MFTSELTKQHKYEDTDQGRRTDHAGDMEA